LNYENLAEYNFDQNNYKTSGAYYDSVLTNLPENTKKYRATKKKFDNLEDVIKYEDIVQYSDSKRAEEEARKKAEEKITAGFASFVNSKGGKENKGKFYFYNITSLGYGKNEFTNKWGNRELEDDWRWSNKTKALPVQTGDTNIVANDSTSANIASEEKYSLDYYMNQIPKDVAVIDSLKTERNFANYQLGLIYKEKFKENFLAAEKLENVLKSEPEERLVLPSKYNLYKIYEEEGSTLANSMKDNIIQNHATSRYAEILLNPQAVLVDDADSPEAQYSALYKLYKKNVKSKCDWQITRLY